MATTTLITTTGRKVMMYRSYTQNNDLSATQYLPPSKIKLGINQANVSVASTDLTTPIPISNGTINDDGSNTFTGSSGGDNSTDNTSIYKEAGVGVDNTSQNLIANGTSATKIWDISDLSSAGTVCSATQYVGLWLYILDATALAKFLSAGTCLSIIIGSDSSNYYAFDYEASDLSVGWNWLNPGILNTGTETGTVGSPIDFFRIQIVTNNATDEFAAGEVVYDSLRQWEYSDTISAFETDYPSIDLNNNEVTIRAKIPSTKANGFFIDGVSLVNEDASPLTTDITKNTGNSKSQTDEFIYIVKNRLL